jgi:RNA polymerase sigma-70 factor (ECF subfamily)
MEQRVHPTDEELVEALMAGDGAALRPLVERHHAGLLGFLYRMVAGDRGLAEDLVQDTFVRVIRQRTYISGRPFKPWLYSIAANLVRDHYRRREPLAGGAGDEGMASVVDPRPGPEAGALAAERRDAVLDAVGRLGHDYRAALMLRFFHDMSLQQVAEALDIPVGTVKSRLNAGARKLRALLDVEIGDGP